MTVRKRSSQDSCGTFIRMEQQPKKKPGRPATGQTTKRNVRIGATWDKAEDLAKELGLTATTYVERALIRENTRVERVLAQQRAEAERAAAAAAMPVTTELNSDQAHLLVKVRRGWMSHLSDGTRRRFDGNARPHDLTQGEDLMLDKLLEADMVSPEPRDPEHGVLRVLGVTYTPYSLTEKGRTALIEWEQAQE
jgi:hypothetical protein